MCNRRRELHQKEAQEYSALYAPRSGTLSTPAKIRNLCSTVSAHCTSLGPITDTVRNTLILQLVKLHELCQLTLTNCLFVQRFPESCLHTRSATQSTFTCFCETPKFAEERKQIN